MLDQQHRRRRRGSARDVSRISLRARPPARRRPARRAAARAAGWRARWRSRAGAACRRRSAPTGWSHARRRGGSARAASAASSTTAAHARRAAATSAPPSPLRCATASASVSSGVRPSKSWLIWKVRDQAAAHARVRAASAGDVLAVEQRSRPPVGSSTPVSRLTSVVLPAPFGPISAWRAPCVERQRDVVASPRCRRSACRGRSSQDGASCERRRSRCGSAARAEPGPRPQRAARGRRARARRGRGRARTASTAASRSDEHVVQQLEDDRADDAAVEIAGAADHEHEQHVGASDGSRTRRARRSRVVCASSAPATPASAAAMV